MWTFIGLLCFLGALLFFGTAIYSIVQGDFAIMKFSFILSVISLIIFLVSPFRSVAFDVLFDSSTEQEVTEVETADEKRVFKNEKGEMTEIHLSEDDSKEIVPNGWTVVAKQYDPKSGEWLDVYRPETLQQVLTPNTFKDQFNEISKITIGEDRFLIEEITVQSGEVNDVFQVVFNEKMIINGVLNSENEIISMVAFLEDDGSAETGPYNIEIGKALIRIFNPTITDEEILQILEKLKYLTGYTELRRQIGKTYTEKIDNIKYTSDFMIASDNTVLCLLGIEKAK